MHTGQENTMTERDMPHMPIDHNVLMGEIRALLREDEVLMKY